MHTCPQEQGWTAQAQRGLSLETPPLPGLNKTVNQEDKMMGSYWEEGISGRRNTNKNRDTRKSMGFEENGDGLEFLEYKV